ncbi:50S ribosomal protein L15 [Candidatus Peregrinibacteria bacterium]|nr:50S ribosomal protein L15 [Candidatus Peregrinibacteria bacterium]
MSLLELHSKVPKKQKKRRGRGDSAGQGSYSGHGIKGQTARSGGRRRPGFEGGQTPYLRRIPKLKGFKNPNHFEYQVVNIGQLNIFDENTEITKELLLGKNLISKKNNPVKLLGGKGELTKKLTIVVDRASKSALAAVEGKKGKVVLHSPTIKTKK